VNLRGDWALKLLALAVALTIWGILATRDRIMVAATVPVDYVGLPAHLVVEGGRGDAVEVRVAVARWAQRRFRPERLRVRVDLRGAAEGEHSVPVGPGDVQAPPGVRVRGVDPPRMRVHVAPAHEARLRVIPVVRGAPAPGHRVAGVVVDPIAVVVKGPRSTIEARDSVQTAPVDVAGRRSAVTRSVGLAFPEAVSAVGDGSVKVTVDIRAESGTALETEGLRK
jgi:YbbR domain-containing protein